MLTDQEIFKRHPELLEEREFHTNEEIVKTFVSGGSMWRVFLPSWDRDGILQREIIGVDTYRGACKAEHGTMILYYEDPLFPDEPDYEILEDLQDIPGKSVFTNEEQARAYLEMVRNAFENDPEWQRREYSPEYHAEQWRKIYELIDSASDADEQKTIH